MEQFNFENEDEYLDDLDNDDYEEDYEDFYDEED